MRIAIFCHSLLSDWNHGNAHFLRGVATELIASGQQVEIYEPRNAWSVEGMIAEVGEAGLYAFEHYYPYLKTIRYKQGQIDLERALDGVNLVLVHEWNDPELVARIGQLRRQSPGMVALFHDTHHRAVSNLSAIADLDLCHYDGALLFGRSLAEVYQRHGLAQRTWVWHEAADTRLFHPLPEVATKFELAWIGNWGDEERSAELREFLLEPVRALGLQACVYGVRYPGAALDELHAAGIAFCGWLPNFKVPQILAAARLTVHVPRMPYVHLLPGIPTIRVFEALACGVPLVCAPWEDVEGLFEPGAFQIAKNRVDMQSRLRAILNDPAMAREMAQRGLSSVRRRHTCTHRADELLNIYDELTAGRFSPSPTPVRSFPGQSLKRRSTVMDNCRG